MRINVVSGMQPENPLCSLVTAYFCNCVHVCRFARELALPALPEMVFPNNSLCLEHEAGCMLEFTALDALRRVDALHDTLKVAVAEEWSRTQ